MHTLAQLESGALQGATHLKLAEGLTVFPEAIFSLADTLEVLDLSGNQLTALPDDLHRFKKLKVIFASNNPFTELPASLGQCENLEMIGFKANAISQVPAAALPPKLRWLILTDNQITELPLAIGKLPYLQKLMLAGNQLTHLPSTIANCQNLQLLRISANQFDHLPDAILNLPKLSWLAFAGNPFAKWPSATESIFQISLKQLELKATLGQGASGVIRLAHVQDSKLPLPRQVAIKVFKGDVTSDGYPLDELQASLLAGRHDNLVEPLAKITDSDCSALIMRLIPEGYTNLGLPPSLQSCTRDVFPEGFTLTAEQANSYCQQIRDCVTHLHEQGICHGDIYAHNVLVNEGDHLLFGDFGAASPLYSLTREQQSAVRAIEQRAVAAFEEDVRHASHANLNFHFVT